MPLMDWTLYYWNLPFRVAPIDMVFSLEGVDVKRPPPSEVVRLKNAPVAEQPVAAMAPPFLQNEKEGIALSQMPAIMLYLCQRFGRLPKGELGAVQLAKVLGDMTDILCEMTRNNGHQMWDEEALVSFLDSRLPRWAEISRLNEEKWGSMRRDKVPNGVDLAQWAIWGCIHHSFPELHSWFERKAPGILEHLELMQQVPQAQAVFEQNEKLYGNAYCGGQIEASLRSHLKRQRVSQLLD